MVIGLYVPSMCEKASASAIFVEHLLWTHSAFPYLLWLYVRPRVNRAQLYHEEDRRWSSFIKDGKVECNQCARLQTTLYRNLSLDSRVIAEICYEVHRNYSKTIFVWYFLTRLLVLHIWRYPEEWRPQSFVSLTSLVWLEFFAVSELGANCRCKAECWVASACAGSSEAGVRKGAHVTQHVLKSFVEGSFPCFWTFQRWGCEIFLGLINAGWICF
jgi:hypothetical protein